MSIQKLKFSSYGKTIDGKNYCSGVETLAENFIEENETDATIVYPSKNGFISPRTSTYTLTTENCEIYLPVPIHKIKRVLLCLNNPQSRYPCRYYTWHKGTSVDNYVDTGEPFPEYIDVTPGFVTDIEWKALPRASSDEDAIYNLRQENTLTYAIGTQDIIIPSTTRNFGFSFGAGIPMYERFVVHGLFQFFKDRGDGHLAGEGLIPEKDVKGEYRYEFEPGQYDSIKFNEISTDIYKNPRAWRLRIEYIPSTSKTKIRARKNTTDMVDYIQPYNQRAEINAVSAIGKSMYLTAQKTGVREIKIVKNYTRLADIPPLGALVQHNGKRYRLVANTYNQTNTIFVQVTHTLSENWSSRANHLAVDQKYRNWKIPQETLWRNLYWEDYVLISPELNTDIFYPKEQDKTSVSLEHVMQAFMVDKSADETIDTMYFIKGAYGDDLEGVYTSCSTMPVGNSIVFAGQMQDSLSAGLRRRQEDNNLCEDTLYCETDGTLEDMCIILSDGVKNGVFNGNSETTEEPTGADKERLVNDSISWCPAVEKHPELLDYTINAPAKVVMHKDFNVMKDPAEALKFTYQIHFIPDGGLIVGGKIAEHNPLIKRWDRNRKFRVWGIKHPIRDGVDIFTPHEDEQYVEKADDSTRGTFTLTDRTQGLDGNPVFLMRIGIDLTDCIGWCITDENNNIYLASNDASIKTVYFQMTHKRY